LAPCAVRLRPVVCGGEGTTHTSRLTHFSVFFQLANDRFKEPQRILSQHAKSRDVDVIDFTEVFERVIVPDGLIPTLIEKTDNGMSSKDIRALVGEKLQR
jgi:hypothetical protein